MMVNKLAEEKKESIIRGLIDGLEKKDSDKVLAFFLLTKDFACMIYGSLSILSTNPSLY